MPSKYVVLAISALLLACSPSVVAMKGVYLPPSSVGMSGPLVGSVTFSVCSDAATCSDLLLGGYIQAAELPFDVGAWTSVCPPPQGTGSNPNIICGTTPGYEWVGIAFNFAKFPGDNVNFRRAMQFLQDYSYINTTILQGVLGQATTTPVPCFAYASACNPSPMTTHYGTTQNLEAAGEELETASDGTPSTTLYCDNGGVPCGGTYGPSSEWCLGAPGTGSGCGAGTLFSPYLYFPTTLFRYLYGTEMVNWASEIGLQVDSRLSDPFMPCWKFLEGQEVVHPGVYDPSTGYNSDPVFNSTLSADNCPMMIYGFIASGPDLNGMLQQYNSQFDGNGFFTVYDDPTFVAPPDTVAGYLSPIQHTGVCNLDYTTNEVFYATTTAEVDSGARDFMNAYALQVPTVFGYYLNTLYVDNANGWTGFANEPVTGPNELGGLRYTLMNAHACSPTSCTLNENNTGSSIGTANLNVALEGVTDPSGLNPLYNANWAWQADVYGSVYDTPLIVPPAHFNNANYFVDYMTSSHVITDVPGAKVLGTGGGWFYFQQPCANPASPNYARMETACQGRSSPNQAPGPLQRGVGLTAAQRTIDNGQEITLSFKGGIYFYDGIQVTANDYVFSLNLFDVAASPNLIDSGSPAKGSLGGPPGLIAAQMLNSHGGPCSVNCPTVNLYLGSQSIWSLGNVVTSVMPAHILKYFDADHFSTEALGTVDTSLPYGLAATAFAIQGAPHPPANSWMWYLPSLEIGSGPFYLSSWSGSTGGIGFEGVDTANPFYFNPNWKAEANFTVLGNGNGYTIATPLVIDMFNPTFKPIYCPPSQQNPIFPGQSDLCVITNANPGANKVKVYTADGLTLERSLKLTKNPNTGEYSFTLPASYQFARLNGAACSSPSATCYKMPGGTYYAVLQTTYSFHGQLRTWYQVFGFTYS